MNAIYRLFSYLFYPGSIAVIGFYSAKPTTADLLYWMLVMACFVLLPLVFLGIFIKMGYADSVHLPNPKQRNGLYFISVFSAFPALFYFHQNDLKLPLSWGVCVIAVLLGLWLLNRCVLKASAHMAAATGLLFFSLYSGFSLYPWLSMAVVLMPVLYASRLGLKAHTHRELWAGVAAGVMGGGLGCVI